MIDEFGSICKSIPNLTLHGLFNSCTSYTSSQSVSKMGGAARYLSGGGAGAGPSSRGRGRGSHGGGFGAGRGSHRGGFDARPPSNRDAGYPPRCNDYDLVFDEDDRRRDTTDRHASGGRERDRPSRDNGRRERSRSQSRDKHRDTRRSEGRQERRRSRSRSPYDSRDRDRRHRER